MTFDDFKKLFRRNIKVVAGGPEDKTRGAKVIAIFDALAKALTELLLSKVATLAEGQDLLTNPVPALEDGARYAFTGLWDGLATESTVYVRALTTSTFEPTGTLLRDGVRSLVRVDVAAGTTASTDADAFLHGTYTILQGDLPSPAIQVANAALFAAVGIEDPATGSLNPLAYGSGYTTDGNTLTILPAANPQPGEVVHYSYLTGRAAIDLSQYATKQQIADLIGAAPDALNTLGEIAAQLAADEQGTAAILATQQQHTQQIGALQASGGRNRGNWVASTSYKQFDWVVQAGLTYYANADFTSGATFDATKWTQFGAGLTAAQVLALNPLTFPVMGINVNGLKGYATLEASAAAQCFDTTLNRSVTLTKSTSFLGTLRANGSEVGIPDGMSLRITNGNTLLGVEATGIGSAGTGQLLVYGAFATADTVSAIECPQLVDCQINCNVRGTDKNNQGITARGNTELAGVVGTAQLYLYDLGRYLSVDAGVVVTDRRPTAFTSGGGGGGAGYTLAAATTTTLGGIKVGSGLAVTPDGTLSASGGGGGSTGIDYTNPTTLNAAATLAGNTAYYVTGTGYTLTLPPASDNVGKVIFILIASAATGLYPVVGGGSLTMYAAETMNLRATADGWKQTGGQLLAMSVRLETTLSQQDTIPQNVVWQVPLSNQVELNGPAALRNGSAIVAQRKGRGTLSGGVGLKSNTNAPVFYVIRRRRAGTEKYIEQAGVIKFPDGYPSSPVAQTAFSLPVVVEAGDEYDLALYVEGPFSLRGSNPGSECVLAYLETV
jgi:hypothetical protein